MKQNTKSVLRLRYYAETDRIKFQEARLKEGFHRVAVLKSPGPWIERGCQEFRMMAMWAFFHPAGKVATIEWHKTSDGEHTVHLPPQQCFYTNSKALMQVLKDYEVELDHDLPLKCNLTHLKHLREQVKALERRRWSNHSWVIAPDRTIGCYFFFRGSTSSDEVEPRKSGWLLI